MRPVVPAADGGSAPGPFLRGLTIGVLIGAAIAGSRVWRSVFRRDVRRA